MPPGHHLIAGRRVPDDATAGSAAADGPTPDLARSTPAAVELACAAAGSALAAFAARSGTARARFLDSIAEAIELRAAAITEIGMQETGLPAAWLAAERGDAVGQLRRFAGHIRRGAAAGRGQDDATRADGPSWSRPGVKLAWRPVGPVALLDAAKLPRAFSAVGGDMASALAAGCPVVVKGHPGHPGTAEILAEAVAEAARAAGMPEGVFSLIQDGGRITGEALVAHPLIRAVGFAGPQAEGRALSGLCAVARREPIPFFARPGAVNPMFLLPAALAARAGVIAGDWAARLTQRAGQCCGRPGLAIVIDGPDADRFVAASRAALAEAGSQTMASGGIAAACRQDSDRMAAGRGVRAVLAPAGGGRRVMPCLLEVAAADWLDDPLLAGEVFGPFGLIVRARHAAEMLDLARRLPEQRSCILHLDPADTALAQSLMPVLERRAGHVLANGFSTAIAAGDGMAHGGPSPAGTNSAVTSADKLAIRRWLRPVCYQNLPADLLPTDLLPSDLLPADPLSEDRCA
ncbi:MAG: aldehyde dehydrogenase family protein [Rhodobacteraceae bacterium]|jgi:alpha-ketoglutaric semialdehyde dehydrogenase|nr:aldehyde dehydrogenase family protein [Paracoccaceae bacterium]